MSKLCGHVLRQSFNKKKGAAVFLADWGGFIHTKAKTITSEKLQYKLTISEKYLYSALYLLFVNNCLAEQVTLFHDKLIVCRSSGERRM